MREKKRKGGKAGRAGRAGRQTGEREGRPREEKRTRNGTSAVPAKSREVLPSEAPYETDNQREERKRLLRRIKGYIEGLLFAPKGWMWCRGYGCRERGRGDRNCLGRVSGF